VERGVEHSIETRLAVLEGIHEVMDAGVLADLELTDLYISIDDGSYHELDSTVDAFREAAREAVTAAVRQAGPMILEALSQVTVTAPASLIDSAEALVKSHGGRSEITASQMAKRRLTTTIPAGGVNRLIAEVLQIGEGIVSISSASAGFRPRSEPPEAVEEWVVRS